MAWQTTPVTAAVPTLPRACFSSTTQARSCSSSPPTRTDHWDIPDGYVETGETPAQAATREIREELGIEATVGPLLVADWAPQSEEGDKPLFVFDGGTLTAERIRNQGPAALGRRGGGKMGSRSSGMPIVL